MPESQVLKNLVVIGSSTGGCNILPRIVSKIPVLNAALLIVQHMPKNINENFLRILNDKSRMSVIMAVDGAELQHGRIYLAPTGLHCSILQNKTIRLFQGPKYNFVCPSIDLAMLSLKRLGNGGRIIGIVLSGMGHDGGAGIAHIKHISGITVAQKRSTCSVSSMPVNAIKSSEIDYILSPDEIADLLSDMFSDDGNRL